MLFYLHRYNLHRYILWKEGENINNIELKILIGMHRNVNKIDRKTAAIAAEYGLTFSQFAVLEVLYSKGDMTVGMVRERILSSMGTIPLIINNLVKRNYVERISDAKDRRRCILHLTDEGLEVIKKVAPKNARMIAEHIAVLSEEEREQLLYLMKKLGDRSNEKKSKEKSNGI